MLLAGIQANRLNAMGVGPSLLAGIEADGTNHSLATLNQFGWRVTCEDSLILRCPFVMEAARFAAVCQRRKRPRVQALAFERVIDGRLGLVSNDRDIRKANLLKIGPDHVEVGDGFWFLRRQYRQTGSDRA